MAKKLDIDRVHNTFNRVVTGRGSGKTTNMLIQALTETDFGNNVTVVALNSVSVPYLEYLLRFLIREMGYSIIKVDRKKFYLDNGQWIEIIPPYTDLKGKSSIIYRDEGLFY